MANCHTHPAEPTAGTCRSCLHEFCDHCLVYSFGRAKPPFCIPCALDVAGVQRGESHPTKRCGDVTGW